MDPRASSASSGTDSWSPQDGVKLGLGTACDCRQLRSRDADPSLGLAGTEAHDAGRTTRPVKRTVKMCSAHSRRTSVLVAIDKTAPLLLITSPTRGELVEAGPVVIRGTATDGLSGLLGVACNGTAATLDDTGFTCEVTVPVGTTTIEVRATDVAANVRTVTLDVTTVDDIGTTPPTRMRVSPATATLVVGASRAFAVRDDLGRMPRGVTWSASPEGVVSLDTAAGGVTVVAQAAGVVHVTASWQGLTADATVTVLATVGTMPEVVTLWSAPTVGGAVQRIVQGATTIDGTHRLYTYESTGEDDGQDVIRAFEADGREAWSAAAGGRVLQLSGDPSGGVVALVDDRPAYTTRLQVFGPSGSGGGGPAGVGPFAIHPNGPLYYVDQGNTLVGLDIGLGSGPGTTVAGTPGYPTVLADGSVVVPSVLDPQRFQLTFVRPDGVVETQVIASPSAYLSYASRAIPNGQGGLLVQLHRWLWREMSSEVWDFDTLVVGVDATGNVTGSEPLGADWGEIVVGEGGTVLATSKVDYWTEPFYGGVRKHHVGMVTPLTPAGNRAAFPTFFGPSGPCGWAWDGIGERWYYNGDCDQEVISVTSVVALGRGGFITGLSNGRSFGADPLFEQLPLSHLQPVGGGDYLAAGPVGLIRLGLAPAPTTAFAMSYGWSNGGGGQRWANAERRSYATIDAAAIAILRQELPISNRNNKEFGGSICRNDIGRYIPSEAERAEADCGEVKLPPCASGTFVGDYHTHVCLDAQDGPSGPDLRRSYWLNAPGYLGVNTAKEVRPVDCASRGEGNIWNWVMDRSVPYNPFDPVFKFPREVIACAPVK
jgi:hypothetical protein